MRTNLAKKYIGKFVSRKGISLDDNLAYFYEVRDNTVYGIRCDSIIKGDPRTWVFQDTSGGQLPTYFKYFKPTRRQRQFLIINIFTTFDFLRKIS